MQVLVVNRKIWHLGAACTQVTSKSHIPNLIFFSRDIETVIATS